MADATELETQVLVVGGGPVGLAMSHLLRARGVDALTVERRLVRATQPKAKYVNVRSMAILRTLGLAEAVRAASPFPWHEAPHVHYVPSLTAEPLRTVRDAFPLRPLRDARYPEEGARLPQPVFESVLETSLREVGRSPLRGYELTAVSEGEEGVVATVRGPAGEAVSIRADYLVGADGARSAVRHHLGASFEGEADVARSIGAVFHAPGLAEAVVAGPGIHYWVVHPGLPATLGFGPLDTNGTWFFQAMGVDDGTSADAGHIAELIRTAIGREIAFELRDTEQWVVHDLQATSYGGARCFLIGDAAHLHPPTGGFGMNMGIGDAYDLSWKLAAVLAGWAPPELLATYEQERRPIHRATMDQAMANFRAVDLRPADRLDAAARGEVPQYFDSLGLQLGYSYAGSPLVVGEVEGGGVASPGRLLPHAWMPDGSALQDGLGPWFTLLDGGSGRAAAAFKDAAARLRVPVRVVHCSEQLRRTLGAEQLLVRPDQHIAWRGSGPVLASDVLRVATGHPSQLRAASR